MQTDNEDSSREASSAERYGLLILGALNLVWLTAAAVLIAISGAGNPAEIIEGILGWALLAGYVLFKVVKTNRLAGLLVFGRYVKDLEAGLHYAPPGITQIIHVTKEVIESDLPDSPEFIYHGDPTAKKPDGSPGDGKIPAGMTPALRFPFPGKEATKDVEVTIKVPQEDGTEKEIVYTIPKDDSLLKRQTAEVEISYGFRVRNLRSFYEAVGNVDNAKRDMDDHTIGGFNSRMLKCTLAENLYRLEQTCSEVKKELSEYSKDWGIEVTFARLKPIGLSHQYNTALTLRAAAIEDKKTTITKSEAEREARQNKGRGDGSYNQSVLEGTAAGQKALIEASKLDDGRTQAIQAVGNALKNANLVVAPQDNLLGAVASIPSVLKAVSPTQPPPPAPPESDELVGVGPSEPAPSSQPQQQRPHGRGKNRGKR
jgi:regulator of protease activity HflC (stomatin/prohibitin superfamily)